MELKLDQWATTPPVGYPGAVPPPPGKRSAGFTNGEEPPAGYFNHAWDALADTQNELANLITGAGLTRSESDLSQVLAAINRLINRKAELVGITRWQDICNGSDTALGIATSPTDVVAVVQANPTIRRLGMTNATWSPIAPNASYVGVFQDVCWSATFGKFIAAGTGGEIQDSPTGGAWTRRTSSGPNWIRCVAGASAVVAMPNDGTAFKSTIDGTTWVTRASAQTDAMGGLAYSPTLNRFCAVGGSVDNGNKIQRSDSSGANWAPATSVPATIDPTNEVIWSAEAGCFFALAGHNVLRSSDGLVWSLAAPSVAFPGSAMGFPQAIVTLPEHAVLISSDGVYIKLHRLSELNGAPTNGVDMSLLYAPSGVGDSFTRVVHVQPGSGLQFAGRLLWLCNSGRIRVSNYLG
jgi:hypothetical protein